MKWPWIRGGYRQSVALGEIQSRANDEGRCVNMARWVTKAEASEVGARSRRGVGTLEGIEIGVSLDRARPLVCSFITAGIGVSYWRGAAIEKAEIGSRFLA